jgi:nucleoid-associated protein YgaU
MGLITDVKLRQPVENELVGRRFLVAGIGAGFEGTIGIRVLGPQGKVLATDSAQSAGGGFGIGEFSTHVRLDDPPRAGTRLTVQVFGDNPGLPDNGPSPGFDLQENEVIVFPKMQGWLLYRVVSGDTLSGIVKKVRPFTKVTVNQIVLANPRIEDPDLIKVGWRLRIPIQS